jgi:hypothetical protein
MYVSSVEGAGLNRLPWSGTTSLGGHDIAACVLLFFFFALDMKPESKAA